MHQIVLKHLFQSVCPEILVSRAYQDLTMAAGIIALDNLGLPFWVYYPFLGKLLILEDNQI